MYYENVNYHITVGDLDYIVIIVVVAMVVHEVLVYIIFKNLNDFHDVVYFVDNFESFLFHHSHRCDTGFFSSSTLSSERIGEAIKKRKENSEKDQICIGYYFSFFNSRLEAR